MKTTLKSCTIIYTIISALLLLGGLSAQAASQVWTNAPADTNWTTTGNWDGGAFPGALNMTGNTVNGDVATFNQPIPSSGPTAGFGGAQFPITTANSTISGDRALQISGITFDTANCGSYVFQGNLANGPMAYPGTNILFVSHLGSITMNSTVNNSQIFMVPIFVRLPSSTYGTYSFINNSANPAATLYFQSITNDSATSRGTDFVLGGSNTGTNTVAYLSRGLNDNPNTGSGNVTADQGFTKSGTGTWILQNIGGSDFQRGTAVAINDGTLKIVDSGCWGASGNGSGSSPITVNSNAVEVLINCGQTNSLINGNGTIQASGASYVAMLGVGTGTATTPHLTTTISSDVLTMGINTALEPDALTGGSATALVHIGGPGTVQLATNSTYVGSWSVDTGTLQIGATTALGTGPNLNIAAGAIVDLTPLGAGVTFNPSTSGIGASGTGTTVGTTAATVKPDAAGTLDLATGAKNINLTYNPTSFTGDTTHPALYISQGTLNVGGNTITVNNISGTPLGTGTYVLIQVASGNINNAGNLAANVTGSGVASGDVGTITISGGNVDLSVAPYVPKHLVWAGGNPNNNWDVNTTLNFLNGASPSVFNNSDFVTFNSTGAAHPIVSLVGSLIPGQPVLVDTTAANYQFTGSGAIGGTASLTKMGTGTLIVSNLNSYLGATVVSNGAVQLGTNNALSGNSDLTISNIATVDLNSWNAAIGALNGNGIVDTVAGGTPTLTVGNNADSGSFSGTIQNSAGTLAVTKANIGTETLSGANTYSGATTINGGTLRVANLNALGSGNSAVTINSGTILDVSSNVKAASIAGVGTIENNSTTTTNELIIQGTSAINGLIADGSGGGGMSVLISGGTTTFSLAGTYSGGTVVASGATLAVQNVSPSPNPGTGGIVLSNNATLGMPGTGASTAAIGNPILTVNNAEASFTSADAANAIGGLFIGSTTSTNLFFGGAFTIGGNAANFQTFTNFLGTVIVTNGNVRAFGTLNGGQLTAFDFIGNGGWDCRDGLDTIHFGSLSGDDTGIISTGAGGNGVNLGSPDTYIIGENNQSTVYSGSIVGSNNIVKAGTGTLAFNGGGFLFTNIFTPGLFTITNISYGSNQINFIGTTTVSNGVLALVAPTLLTNSTTITLASVSAVLDVGSMGYISNQLASDDVTITNSFVVTNSTFELIVNSVLGPQTMGGVGTLNGNLIADSGTTLTPGLPTGIFNVTTNAALSGQVNMDLDSTNAATNSEFAAGSFTINSGAALVVTNIGPGLILNAKFQLFNHPVSGFSSVLLPAKDPTGGTNYIWQNFLAVDGSITLTNGGVVVAPANPPPITASFSGNTLTLSWPPAYLGYILQAQTNPLTVGVSTNWVSVPNSSSVTSTNITINPANPTVFYRLIQ